MRWIQGSRGEEDSGCDGCKVLGGEDDRDAMDARFEGIGRLRMRWMQGTMEEEDSGCDGCKVLEEEEDWGCDGCNVLGERKTADAMDAMF